MTMFQMHKPSIAIVYRGGTPKALQCAQKVVQLMNKKGIEVLTAPEQKMIQRTQLIKSKKDWDRVGLVVVLGGDGTYLRAVRLLQGRDIPLLAFNMGSLGFLTVHPAEEVHRLMTHALSGELEIRERSMLAAKLLRKGKTRGEFLALNDVVIERGPTAQLINTSLFSDRHLVSTIKADGVIVATPTGSTAYNLAAGGPILDPESSAMVVTPVAPHALTNRPLIFPDHRKISFRLADRGSRARLIVDGQMSAELTDQDEVRVSRSGTKHCTLREPEFNFFDLLREKMKFGDRA
ncbi:MAG: NAD(+)/NADH kinase [Bdellovibrionaceae bacterium]|nr:NAD(+)/NADH kinase [Pseudobdellovibrionaceae bacterium]